MNRPKVTLATNCLQDDVVAYLDEAIAAIVSSRLDPMSDGAAASAMAAVCKITVAKHVLEDAIRSAIEKELAAEQRDEIKGMASALASSSGRANQ